MKVLLDLLKSKRFILLLAGGVSLVAVRLGLNLDSETAEKLAEQLTILVSTAIGGVSLSDAAKALTMPASVDHKGQS